jgi:hypothetical protein
MFINGIKIRLTFCCEKMVDEQTERQNRNKVILFIISYIYY